jgi:hypothetical protein
MNQLVYNTYKIGNVTMKHSDSYLKQTKMPFREQEGKTDSVWGSGYQWEGENIRKRVQKVNMVEVFCTIYENGKMRPIETIPGMGVGGINENVRGG